MAYSNELVPCHIDNVLDIMMMGHVTDVWFHTSVAQADSTVTAIETSAASVKSGCVSSSQHTSSMYRMLNSHHIINITTVM